MTSDIISRAFTTLGSLAPNSLGLLRPTHAATLASHLKMHSRVLSVGTVDRDEKPGGELFKVHAHITEDDLHTEADDLTPALLETLARKMAPNLDAALRRYIAEQGHVLGPSLSLSVWRHITLALEPDNHVVIGVRVALCQPQVVPEEEISVGCLSAADRLAPIAVALLRAYRHAPRNERTTRDLYLALSAAQEGLVSAGLITERVDIHVRHDTLDVTLGEQGERVVMLRETATEAEQSSFEKHLDHASTVVGDWPEWKRQILGVPEP